MVRHAFTLILFCFSRQRRRSGTEDAGWRAGCLPPVDPNLAGKRFSRRRISIRVGLYMTYLRRAAVCAWVRALWRDDTKTEEHVPEEHIPCFLFHLNVTNELAFYGRWVLKGAVVANPGRLAQKSAVERKLLLPLVRARRIIPVQTRWSRMRSLCNFCDNLTLGGCPCWVWMVAVS